MRDDIDPGVAESLELAADAVAIVISDRLAATAELRPALSIWDLLGSNPRVLALGERLLERALQTARLEE